MLTKFLNYGKLHVNEFQERRIGMKKIYEAPVLDIEKFQFEPTMVPGAGISRDDPPTGGYDPFD